MTATKPVPVGILISHWYDLSEKKPDEGRFVLIAYRNSGECTFSSNVWGKSTSERYQSYERILPGTFYWCYIESPFGDEE